MRKISFILTFLCIVLTSCSTTKNFNQKVDELLIGFNSKSIDATYIDEQPNYYYILQYNYDATTGQVTVSEQENDEHLSFQKSPDGSYSITINDKHYTNNSENTSEFSKEEVEKNYINYDYRSIFISLLENVKYSTTKHGKVTKKDDTLISSGQFIIENETTTFSSSINENATHLTDQTQTADGAKTDLKLTVD